MIKNNSRFTELLNIFKTKGINHTPDKGLDLVLEYQDIIGQASMLEISESHKALDSELKRTFFWANSITLGEYTSMDILRDCVMIPEIEKRTEEKTIELEEKNNNQFNLGLIQKKLIDDKTKEINSLKKENSYLHAELEKTDSKNEAIENLEKENSFLKGIINKIKALSEY